MNAQNYHVDISLIHIMYWPPPRMGHFCPKQRHENWECETTTTMTMVTVKEKPIRKCYCCCCSLSYASFILKYLSLVGIVECGYTQNVHIHSTHTHASNIKFELHENTHVHHFERGKRLGEICTRTNRHIYTVYGCL